MSTADFWARKMSGRPAARSNVPLPPTPVARPVAPAQPRMTPTVNPPEPKGCPECGSPNYGGGAGGSAKRCFTCGYIDGRDYRNSTQGMTGGTGPITAAPGQQTGTYSPTTIVGRVE